MSIFYNSLLICAALTVINKPHSSWVNTFINQCHDTKHFDLNDFSTTTNLSHNHTSCIGITSNATKAAFQRLNLCEKICEPLPNLCDITALWTWTTDLYWFLSRCCSTYSCRISIMSPPIGLLAYLQKWWPVLLNGADGRSVNASTQRISRVVAKWTNFKWGMFDMFNIIVTLQNCFTSELLLDYLSSETAFHFNVNQWRPF